MYFKTCINGEWIFFVRIFQPLIVQIIANLLAYTCHSIYYDRHGFKYKSVYIFRITVVSKKPSPRSYRIKLSTINVKKNNGKIYQQKIFLYLRIITFTFSNWPRSNMVGSLSLCQLSGVLSFINNTKRSFSLLYLLKLKSPFISSCKLGNKESRLVPCAITGWYCLIIPACHTVITL